MSTKREKNDAPMTRRLRMLRTLSAIAVPAAVLAACANDDNTAKTYEPWRSEVYEGPEGFGSLWRTCIDGEGFVVTQKGDLALVGRWEDWCPVEPPPAPPSAPPAPTDERYRR